MVRNQIYPDFFLYLLLKIDLWSKKLIRVMEDTEIESTEEVCITEYSNPWINEVL